MKIQISQIETFATTKLRGQLKIFQILEKIENQEQFVQIAQKSGIDYLNSLNIYNHLQQGRRRRARKIFIEKTAI